MGALSPWHIAILVVVLVLLFGAKRLPDASRSLGRSLRIFKAETKGLMNDDEQAPAAKADYTQTPDDEPSPLPAASQTLQDQRAEAQRFLDATSTQATSTQPAPARASAPAQYAAPAEPPTQQR